MINTKGRCVGCAMGAHPHDRWTANAPEVRRGERQAGEDAGCPFQGCRCTYVEPVRIPEPHCSTCRCGVGQVPTEEQRP